MSTPNPIPRPPSRSERLLRDTLRKDDTRRIHGTRPRSGSASCDEDEDEDFFQSAVLFRYSPHRTSATSAPGHANPPGLYVPDESERASYPRPLRSSSYSGSSHSGCSDHKSSPRPVRTRERQEERSRLHDAAPHEAVLRNRLDSVMHNMWIDNDKGVDTLTHVQPRTASPPSSLSSISNSQAHSHESHQTHLTVPDSDPCARLSPRRSFPKGHRHSQSASVVHNHPTSLQRPSAPSRAVSHSPQSSRALHGLRSTPQTPTSQEKERLKRLHPESPWMYTQLPPSPPTFQASPSKRGSPAVMTFVANPSMVGTPAHLPARSPARHSPNSPTFDPEAASHALRQLPGYVSFASVAGLGAPPEEEDRRTTRKPFAGLTLGSGKGRLSGLGLGGGKWWMF